jgi:two-component system sensor histidine kinase KdpD
MRSTPTAYAWSVLTTALATGIAYLLLHRFAPTNLAMIYLLGVVFVAARFGRGPAILASVLSVCAFDFLFIPPYYSFAVDDTEYVLTFGVLLGVALLTSGLMLRVGRQAETARLRELHTSALYRMSREFSRAVSRAEIVRIAEEKMGEILGADVWVFLPAADGTLAPAPGVTSAFPLAESEMRVAQWVFVSGRPAGRGVENFPEAGALYLPVSGTRGRVGVLGVFENEAKGAPGIERRQLLDAIAGQLALALERDALAEEAREAKFRLESDRLRETLLSSVSHDLRTPLATIAGAASGLIDGDRALDEATRRDMVLSICEEADRLNRLVNNLLNMTRIESGALHLRKEWHPLDEVIGSALTVLKRRLGDRPVQTRVAEDLPLVPMDGILIEQVLVNLIENALRHAGARGPIEIEAAERSGEAAGDREVVVSVADRGPGIPPGEERVIFEKFGRATRDPASAGVGLGLAICRGIVEEHGGRIWAENREGGGAVFAFALPVGRDAPETIEESEE